jgi:hypothetical protein
MEECQIKEVKIESQRAIVLENSKIKVSVLIDKGADIYELIYKPKNIDVLWKTPWGIKDPKHGVSTASNSHVAWMENYSGGWQELFPSGGGPCVYKGVEMNFHGEVSTLPWKHQIVSDTTEEVSVTFSVRTYRSPFYLERTLTLRKEEEKLHIRERLTNLAGEKMDYMWGHHPALGAPFIDEGVIIDIPAGWIESQNMENEFTRLPKKSRFSWPIAEGTNGEKINLSTVPYKENQSADLAFFGELDEGWYGITNPKLGFGFGMVWPKELFPYAWLWQEFMGSEGWPWYKSAYVMAIEPFTSYDESGLTHCIENGTARSIQPGETIEVELTALFFESRNGISYISPTGEVAIKK